MFRISLRRSFFFFTLCAVFLAVVGLLLNQTRLVQELFNSGDRRVVIESSPVTPRGTFLEVYSGNRCVIDRCMISHHPIKASEIVTHEYDSTGRVVAYYYNNPNPIVMNVLLLIDFDLEAYAVFWAGCRAQKCEKLDWKTWDRRCTNFMQYLDTLSE